MKFYIFLSVIITAIIVIECSHTFMGTSVQRPVVYKRQLKYSSYLFAKRIEYLNFTMPVTYGYAKKIQGILAYDLTNTGASANVTGGGLGYSFVSLRMKSDRGSGINYDVWIYA